MKKQAALALAALLGCLSPSGAATAPSGPPLTLDVIISATGSAAFFGQQGITAFKAFENEVNAEGGIRGQPVHFEIHDDESKPQVAVELATQIFAKHPAVVFGPSVQATCNAVGALAAQGPVVYCVSPGLIPEPRSYVFSASASLTHIMPAQFRYLRSSDKRRLAMLVSTDATGQRSDQMLDYTLKLADNASMVPVAHEHFADGDLNIAAQLARIRSTNPQILYVSAAGTPFQTVMRGLIDAGMLDLPVLTSAANMTPATLAPYVKTPPAQLLFNGPRFWGSTADADPRVRAVIAQYRAAFQRVGAEPTPNDDYYWDPGRIVVDGLRKLGPNATAAQLHDYIEQLHDFPGLAGIYDFRNGDQHGLGDEATVVLQWDPQNGTFFPVSAPGGNALRKAK